MLLIVLGVLVYIPFFINKQNQKTLNYLRQYIDLIGNKLDHEKKQESQKALVAAKLQAYERMMLFLERINPTNLIPRLIKPGLKASRLQASLLNSIREEYEHNMSQQLYIENKTWDLVKTAKEEVVSLVNLTAIKVKSEDDAASFAREMLSSGFKGGNPVEKAMLSLKDDLKKMFH